MSGKFDPRRLIGKTGDRYGLLVIQEYSRERRKYLMRCDCGKNSFVRMSQLTSGKTKSCGCLRATVATKVKTKHGMKHSRVYRVWNHIKNRCADQKNKNYGAIGVMVCDRWKKFENFYADMGEPPSKNHSIDRINPYGNYEPTNVRWATDVEQQRNRRMALVYEFNGERRHLKEWADILQVPYETLRNRIKHLGWSIDKAFRYKK